MAWLSYANRLKRAAAPAAQPASVEAARVPVKPFAVVFPTYRAEVKTEFLEITKGQTLMRLAENCFNYPVLGAAGFNCLADAVEQSRCYTAIYSDLDDVIAALEG